MLVLLDAFGWRFFDRHAERHPLLRRMLADGTVAKLTTQFPSTTAAHVTTMHTGRPVAEHGMYEWNIYEPSVDALITPLMFSFAGDGERDTLRDAGADPRALYPTGDALSPARRPRGPLPRLPSRLVRAVDLRRRPARRRRRSIRTRPSTRGLRHARRGLAAARGPIYAYVYIDTVDAAGHQYGPSSPEFDAEATRCLDAIEAAARGAPGRDAAAARRRPRPGRRRPRPDAVRQRAVARDRRAPAARRPRPSARSRPARRATCSSTPRRARSGYVVDRLRALLGEDAEVHATADLVAEGLFAGEPGPRLRARIGDVCVLPGARGDRLVARARTLRHALSRPPRRPDAGRGPHARRLARGPVTARA